jgi:hypothetical protein
VRVLIAGRFAKPPHPDISERLARDEPAKISPHRRPAVRAGVVVLVEFHPDIVQARDQHAGGAFHAGNAEPAGVAAALTALARPAHATWFASGLCTSEDLLSRRYPGRFLVFGSGA